MKTNVETIDNKKTLRVKGTLSMAHVKDLRQTLLDSLDSTEHVIFMIEQVEDVSFACLQLLCSTCRTAFIMEKRFSIVPMQHKRFQMIFKHSGYLISDKCGFKRGECCLKAGLADTV